MNLLSSLALSALMPAPLVERTNHLTLVRPCRGRHLHQDFALGELLRATRAQRGDLRRDASLISLSPSSTELSVPLKSNRWLTSEPPGRPGADPGMLLNHVIGMAPMVLRRCRRPNALPSAATRSVSWPSPVQLWPVHGSVPERPKGTEVNPSASPTAAPNPSRLNMDERPQPTPAASLFELEGAGPERALAVLAAQSMCCITVTSSQRPPCGRSLVAPRRP